MAKKIIIANWKMNPESISEAKKLLQLVKKGTSRLKKTMVVIAPPFQYLHLLNPIKNRILLGAQDGFIGGTGAFTGEISFSMLKSMSVSHVILGHSERRAMGETNELISKKILSALKNGITPIVCIGESHRDSQGSYLAFIDEQIRMTLAGLSKKDATKILIAYEPVWAIGKTKDEAMSSEKLHEMSLFIHKILVGMYGREIAKDVPIIYGGSVELGNAGNLIKNGNVVGFLIGHASLKAKEFVDILKDTDNS